MGLEAETIVRVDPARAALVAALRRAGEGDRAAFSTVYRLTSAKLFGVCLRICKDRELAEDALQDAYATIWKTAARFDPERASPISWLATVARNRAIDRVRSVAARPAEPLGEEAENVADGAPDPAARALWSDERRRLQACLDGLDPRAADAIRSAFYEGLTYETLADRAGAPIGTMKSWIRRGLLRLRGCLEA